MKLAQKTIAAATFAQKRINTPTGQKKTPSTDGQRVFKVQTAETSSDHSLLLCSSMRPPIISSSVASS